MNINQCNEMIKFYLHFHQFVYRDAEGMRKGKTQKLPILIQEMVCLLLNERVVIS
jgi:hypothetical protein